MWLSFPFSSPDGQAPTVFVFFDECECLVQNDTSFICKSRDFQQVSNPFEYLNPLVKDTSKDLVLKAIFSAHYSNETLNNLKTDQTLIIN